MEAWCLQEYRGDPRLLDLGPALSWLQASLNGALGLPGPQCPPTRNGTIGKLESTPGSVILLQEHYWYLRLTPAALGEGRRLTEVWGSDPPVTAAPSGPPSSGGNSLRLQVLLRLEQREWEDAQAWQ